MYAYSQNNGNKLSVEIDNLTSPEFAEAVRKSNGVCLIPLGILEKHGPHLPLSTDLILAREVALRAAKKEYALVYPPYYFGQIFEAKHQPGTFAYSKELIWQLLQETCDELSRNGIKKIILVNGHGGNNNFLNYFCQVQLEKPRDYIVLLYKHEDQEFDEEIEKLMQSPSDYHAGELESSIVYSINPDLADTNIANTESGADQARLDSLQNAYTGIWWYAKFPNHYAGDGSIVNSAIGNLFLDTHTKYLAELIKYIKENDDVLELQNEFYERSQNPLGNYK